MANTQKIKSNTFKVNGDTSHILASVTTVRKTCLKAFQLFTYKLQ